MRKSSSSNLPAAIGSIRVYLGGQELAISSPSDMPTIVFLSHNEEDELCILAREWSHLTTFCQTFKDVIVRYGGGPSSDEANKELLTLHELIAHRMVQILIGQHRGRIFSFGA